MVNVHLMQAYHINERIDWWVQVLKLKGQRESQTYKKDVGVIQTGTLFGNWVISRVLDVQMTSNFWKDLVRHRPTTFMWTPRSKKAVSKSKL